MWYRGHCDLKGIEPIWHHMPYVRQPLTPEEEATWRAAGYTQQHFTGEMYDSRNPMPDWVDRMAAQIGLGDCGYVFYRMTTGVIMPTHSDQFNRYCQVFDVERAKVWRAVLFLEDWAPGHYFEIDGQPITDYIRGDYILWRSETPHAASNIGLTPRYTLQITGVDRSIRHRLNHGHELFWANMPMMADSLGFLGNKLRKQTWHASSGEAFMVWTGTGRIKALEELRLSDQQISQLPNGQLTIYLYEPMSLYYQGVRPNRMYYHEFSHPWDLGSIRCTELDSITRFADNHGGRLNISVRTGDYACEVLEWSYPTLDIGTHDIFLRIESTRDHPHIEAVPSTTFWCGNWRWTAHRQLIMSYLTKHPGIYSWHINCPWEVLCDNGWMDLSPLGLDDDIRQLLRTGTDRLNSGMYAIDHPGVTSHVSSVLDFAMPNGAPPRQEDQEIWRSYTDAFCAVVTETRFASPFPNVSEKTLAPMMMLRPFIVVGPAYTLSYLHDLGFKTFSEFWDEGYDRVLDPSLRLLAIFQLCDEIASMTQERRCQLLDGMRDVLTHNQEHVITLAHDRTTTFAADRMMSAIKRHR